MTNFVELFVSCQCGKFRLNKLVEDTYFFLERNQETKDKEIVKFDESLKYITSGGRTVYGGGGIYPDIFIPNDTLGASYYLTNLYYGGAFNHWVFKYLDYRRDNWKRSINEQFHFEIFIGRSGLLHKFGEFT